MTDQTPLVADQEHNLKQIEEDAGGDHIVRHGSVGSAGSGVIPPIAMQEIDVGGPVGKLKVYIQRPEGQQGVFILSVPDLGSTYHVVQRFYHHPSMTEFSRKTTWIHVIPPGQDSGDADLPNNFIFPTFQQLGEAIPKVLDALDIKHTLCFAEGAGANILTHFALQHPDRCDGLVLLHCIGSASSFLGSIRERFAASQLNTMSPSAEHFFVLYHFGKSGDSDFPEVREAMQEFQDRLHQDLNPHNLKQYVNAHIKRVDITEKIGHIKSRVLFVVGENAYLSDAALKFYQSAMEHLRDKSLFDLIKVSGVANVLDAAPEKLSESLLLFVQGLGLLSSILGRSRSTSVRMGRTASMQEADQPSGYYKKDHNLSRQATDESDGAK